MAVALWHQAGLRKSYSVKFCLRWAKELGVDRPAARRGLRQLQEAGLVKVEGRNGQCHQVTILETLVEAVD